MIGRPDEAMDSRSWWSSPVRRVQSDPDVYDRTDTFDIGREPNVHFAFSRGRTLVPWRPVGPDGSVSRAPSAPRIDVQIRIAQRGTPATPKPNPAGLHRTTPAIDTT